MLVNFRVLVPAEPLSFVHWLPAVAELTVPTVLLPLTVVSPYEEDICEAMTVQAAKGTLSYYKGFPGMSTPVFTVSVCTIVKK